MMQVKLLILILWSSAMEDLAGPQDAQYILDNTEGVIGFFGASSRKTSN